MEACWRALKICINKNTGKKPLGNPRHRGEDNISNDIKEVGVNTKNWVDSAQDKDYWKFHVNATFNPGVS